ECVCCVGDAQRAKGGGLNQEGQIAFVGMQGVRLRMRCQYDGVIQVGASQIGMSGLFEHEIGESVVHQINDLIAMPELASAPCQFGRVGDDHVQSQAHQAVLKQQELRVQMLLGRGIVYDGYAVQRACRSEEHTSELQSREN